MLTRRILQAIQKDLSRKMVLLAGARRCGKTTIGRALAKSMKGQYYNWDIASDRKKIRKYELDPDAGLWVFDEIHKMRHWRNWLKGLFDEHQGHHQILVTGSAKLEVYGRGGDSLQGRYYLHHLHPFTFSELQQIPQANTTINIIDGIPKLPINAKKGAEKLLRQLENMGGFPEPFLSASTTEAARWRTSYFHRLVEEEVRSLEGIKNLDQMELLLDRLPETVGSVLSINSLREDLEVAFETVKNWIRIFENLFSVFRIPPFGPAKIKAVKKEQKLYFWDWAAVPDMAHRFENLIAVHLMRLCHWCEDLYGEKVELRYFRTRMGHAVDFILLRKGKPWVAIEVKDSDRPVDPNLKYLLQKVSFPYAFQISRLGIKDYETESIGGCRVRVMPAIRLLANLP